MGIGSTHWLLGDLKGIAQCQGNSVGLHAVSVLVCYHAIPLHAVIRDLHFRDERCCLLRLYKVGISGSLEVPLIGQLIALCLYCHFCGRALGIGSTHRLLGDLKLSSLKHFVIRESKRFFENVVFFACGSGILFKYCVFGNYVLIRHIIIVIILNEPSVFVFGGVCVPLVSVFFGKTRIPLFKDYLILGKGRRWKNDRKHHH